MTWTPPADVRAAGERLRGAVPNVQGSQLTSDDVSLVQLPIQPGVRVLQSYLHDRFGVPVGAPRGASVRKPLRNADGQLRRRDVHEEGRALDVMSERNTALGAQVANWLALNSRALGVQYLIFDRLELSSSLIGPAWEPYATSGDRNQWGRARSPHTDHVHVEISPAFARDGAAMARFLGVPVPADEPAAPARSSTQSVTSSSSSRAHSGATVERTREYTGPRPFPAWSALRFEQLFLTLRDVGLPAIEAMHVARAVLALWITETGWQESTQSGEQNFNPGNITGSSPYGYFTIPGNSRHFRAYAEDVEGVADAVVVLSTGRYRAAWDALVLGGDPVGWYDAILRAGYTGWSQGLVNQYASVLRRIPQRLTR